MSQFIRVDINFNRLKPVVYSPIMIRQVVSDDIRRIERELSYRDYHGFFEVNVEGLGTLIWDNGFKSKGRYRVFHDDDGASDFIPLIERPFPVRLAWYPHVQKFVDEIAKSESESPN